MKFNKAIFALTFICLVTCYLGLSWGEQFQKIKVGAVRPYFAGPPSPYPVGSRDRAAVWQDSVVSPGAEFIRVHFTAFHLQDGDYVTVSSVDGAQFWTYTGKGLHGRGDFWSFAVDGDTAMVTLHAGLNPGHGYRIDKVGHGTKKSEPTQEVVCGTDGREDIACHTNVAGINNAQMTVARLQFVQGASLYLCTGWLVAGSNNSTMLTNNHCFSSQSGVDTVQARFNYQRTTCGGSTDATATNYAGGTFLKTNTVNKKGNKGGLDYTLFTLQGNPEATWGEITATTQAAAIGDLIYFIQHPGGRQKEIGYWEDEAQTARCNVDAVNQTYSRSAAGSQTAYGCDSEGGSSGSPIISATTYRAVALHHFGGVSSNPCLNSGTQMSKICTDASSLLSCASN